MALCELLVLNVSRCHSDGQLAQLDTQTGVSTYPSHLLQSHQEVGSHYKLNPILQTDRPDLPF